MSADLYNKEVQVHIVPEGAEWRVAEGKVGETKREKGSGWKDTEELPLPSVPIRQVKKAGQVRNENLAEWRAKKVREIGYKNSLSSEGHQGMMPSCWLL